jgi:D-xylose transport system ATP-binding protein
MEYILETKNIIKEFPGVRALDRVSFKIKKGEILALCGENGAGKSTLIKVLSGVYPYGSYEGQILLKGQEQRFESIKSAEKKGIAVIHQELALFEELSVAENIFMGNEIQKNGILDWNAMHDQTNKWIKKLRLEGVKPATKVGDLGVGKQQLVEIAKALAKDSKILILDEPTDSFTDAEVDILLNILDDLRKDGVTCIYISHKLDEVFRIANSATVIRDGKAVGSDQIENLSEKDIVKMMVGREISHMFPNKTAKIGEKVLEVKNLNVYDPDNSEKLIVNDVSFSVRKGEVLGISGLVGAGRTELVNSIFGTFPAKKEGEIYLDNEPVEINSALEALEKGIALAPEDRKRFGLIHTMDVRSNTSIACLEKFKESLSVNQSEEILKVQEFVEKLKVKTASLETNIFNLSGGNQQKVVLAKNLMTEPKVLILDEPTRGIDVGAKQEIYSLINELAEQGVAIIMVSSELPEVIGMSDRILVLTEGKVTGRFYNRDNKVTQEEIMACSTGGKDGIDCHVDINDEYLDENNGIYLTGGE